MQKKIKSLKTIFKMKVLKKKDYKHKPRTKMSCFINNTDQNKKLEKLKSESSLKQSPNVHKSNHKKKNKKKKYVLCVDSVSNISKKTDQNDFNESDNLNIFKNIEEGDYHFRNSDNVSKTVTTTQHDEWDVWHLESSHQESLPKDHTLESSRKESDIISLCHSVSHDDNHDNEKNQEEEEDDDDNNSFHLYTNRKDSTSSVGLFNEIQTEFDYRDTSLVNESDKNSYENLFLEDNEQILINENSIDDNLQSSLKLEYLEDKQHTPNQTISPPTQPVFYNQNQFIPMIYPQFSPQIINPPPVYPNMTNPIWNNTSENQVMTGSLKFFNIGEKFGFLIKDCDQMDIFFHLTDMENSGITKEILGGIIPCLPSTFPCPHQDIKSEVSC